MEADELDLDESLATPTSWDWGPRRAQDITLEVGESPMRESLQYI